MELALAALPGVITSCLLAYILIRLLDRQNEERQAHRIEVDRCREDLTKLAESHREEMAAFNQARLNEVANLLQRIQAPEVAVAEHLGHNAPSDPPQMDIEDDEQIQEFARRERSMRQLMSELEARAEELSVEEMS